jgi:hypothetical protein
MAERPAPGASDSPPDEPQPAPGGPAESAAAQPGSVVLGPARYVPLTAEQEREAIAALARLLALVREQHQQHSS